MHIPIENLFVLTFLSYQYSLGMSNNVAHMWLSDCLEINDVKNA